MEFKIFKFKKVKSTNNTAIRIIKNSNIEYGMITSNIQKNGRGQYGKRWISYNGNLFVSFFYKLENLSISLKQITLMDQRAQHFRLRWRSRIKCILHLWYTGARMQVITKR